MCTEATQTQQLNDALRHQPFKPEEIQFSYVKAKRGGTCFNFELFTMNVLVESLGSFNPLDMIEEDVGVSPQDLVDVALTFISLVCDKAKEGLLSQVDPTEFRNYITMQVVVPMGRLSIPVTVKISALPEYSPGDSGKLAADVFREKMGREPDMTSVVSTTYSNPDFKFSRFV